MARIKEYLEHRTVETTQKLLVDELEAIEQQLESLTRTKRDVEERLKIIEKTKEQIMGVVEIKYFAVRPCHVIHAGYQRDGEMDMLIKQLLNRDKKNLYIIGNNRIGSMIPADEVKQQNYRGYQSVFIIDDRGSESIDEGQYLSVSYHGDGEKNHIYIPELIAYADEHQLELAGDFLELLWVDIHQSAVAEEHIIELQIRCVQKTER